MGQILWFLRMKNTISKIMCSSCKSLIDFNEAFIPYNELQFFNWPSFVANSPVGLISITYGLGILVHRNIQVTLITIGYIQLRRLRVLAFGKRADLSA